MPDDETPPSEWVDAVAARLRLTHWDGTGCGTHGTNACSRCYGPSPATADEVAEDVLEALAPLIAARTRAAVGAARAEDAAEAFCEHCGNYHPKIHHRCCESTADAWRDLDAAYAKGRNDALGEAHEAIEAPLNGFMDPYARHGVQLALRIVADLRAAAPKEGRRG